MIQRLCDRVVRAFRKSWFGVRERDGVLVGDTGKGGRKDGGGEMGEAEEGRDEEEEGRHGRPGRGRSGELWANENNDG